MSTVLTDRFIVIIAVIAFVPLFFLNTYTSV